MVCWCRATSSSVNKDPSLCSARLRSICSVIGAMHVDRARTDSDLKLIPLNRPHHAMRCAVNAPSSKAS